MATSRANPLLMIWSSSPGAILTPTLFVLIREEIGSGVFESFARRRTSQQKSRDSIPQQVFWKWRYASSVLTEWFMAATSEAAVSPHNSPRSWPRTSRSRRKNWCWGGICAASSRLRSGRKDTGHDYRYQRQYLALAFSPLSGRRDSGFSRPVAQAECRAGVGGKLRRDCAQGYRRRKCPASGGPQESRQGILSPLSIDRPDAPPLWSA